MLLAGLLLGIASSLHCAAMCGGIAAALMMVPRQKLWLLQSARIASYMIQGALVGAFGTLIYRHLHMPLSYFVLRAAAALALFWIGLSVAGLLPGIVLLDHLAASFAARLRKLGCLAGFVWGAMPCAMVWSALFTAMLSGNARGGALTMLGFGVGTLPGVTAAALGALGLRQMAQRPNLRRVLGLLIAAGAPLSLLLAPGSSALCLIP